MLVDLLENDLFRHERGEFTSASAQQIGRIELTDKSSLFLDEVGDMPLELQSNLLRVLQEQEFERLGSNKQTNVCLIAATNHNLKKVADRESRYRSKHSRLKSPVECNIDNIPDSRRNAAHSQRHGIPGNVRKLENVVKRALLLTRDNVLQLSLPNIAAVTPNTSPVATESAKEGEDEYQIIILVLKGTNGIVAGPKGAAQRLELKRTTLLSRMRRLGIDKDALT